MAMWGTGSFMKACEHCGAAFKVFHAHVRRGRNARFCSVKCKGAAKSALPSQATMIACKCTECGKDFEMRKGRGGTGEFCSVQCMAHWRGRQMAGENHPKWKGGIEARTRKSRTAIARAIRRVGQCEECESTYDLQGHHVEHFADRPDLRESEDNIQVLCAGCHAAKHPELATFILAGSNRRKANHGKALDS